MLHRHRRQQHLYYFQIRHYFPDQQYQFLLSYSSCRHQILHFCWFPMVRILSLRHLQ